MSLLDVFSGKQSLGQWLTGRGPEESYICQNTEQVEAVISTINDISKETLNTAKDSIYAAFEQLNSVPGVAEYIGTFETAQYNEYFEYIREAIVDISETMDSNSQNILAYDKAGLGTKFAATLGMILAKPAEGVLSVIEDFGDGVLSAVGFVSGIIPFVGKDIQKGIGNVVEKEWSHDIFQYDKWAKYSAITEDSAIGNGLRIGGKIAGYVAGGYLMAGAMGLSTTATYGTGLLKASGATWGGTAFAGITGLGSGTEEGLKLDLDYNKAFFHGVGQGAKQAAVAFAVGSTFDRISAAKAAKAAKSAEGADEAVADTAKNVAKEGGDDAVAGGAKETSKLLPGKTIAESSDEMAGAAAKDTAETAAKDVASGTAKDTAENAAKDAVEEGAKKGLRERIGDTLSGAKEKVGNLAGKAGERASNLAGNVKKPFAYVAANGGAKGIAANGGLSLSAIAAQTPGGIASEVAGAVTSEIHNGRVQPEIDVYNNLRGLNEKIQGGDPISEGFKPADGSLIPNQQTPSSSDQTGTNSSDSSNQTVSPGAVSSGGGGGYSGGGGGGGGGYTPTPTPGTTSVPTTATPTTVAPTTATPTTVAPTTASPTSATPTTAAPTTASPTTYVVRPSEPTPAANPGGGGGYTVSPSEPAHSGVEYNGTEAAVDSLELENAEALDTLEDLDETSSSIDTIINNNPNKYNKIPTTPAPINTKNKSSGSVVPIAVGLSVAAAAGLGAKAYMDHKRNNEMEDEEYDEEYDDFESEDWNGDENTVELDYSEANPTDSEQYLEEDNFYQDEDSGYSARNASELAELQ